MSHRAFDRLDHRRWPLPSGPWISRQTWHDVLFAHWPASVESLRRFVPAPLVVQQFGGSSWVGLVPFRMTGVTRRYVPPLPWLSAFPEMNLRLYVELDGRPGVWFISLDAGNSLAVWAARRFFHLPYFRADMRVEHDGQRVRYRSERRGGTARVVFQGVYWPTGVPFESRPGSLEHFLTERYCLYAQAPDGQILTVEIHHQPWPLHAAAAEIQVNEVAPPQGIRVEGAPLLHFSKRLEVLFWPMRPLRSSAPVPGPRCRSAP